MDYYWQSIISIPEPEIKGFSFCNLFVFDMFLNKLSLIRVYEKIGKERDTIGSHMDADDLLTKVSSELNKYVIDKELLYWWPHFLCNTFCLSFCAWQNKLIRDPKL